MQTEKVKVSVRGILCLFIGMSLGGCNTMEGLGTDIKKGGEALERTADRNKPKNSSNFRG